ncbi:putative F-box domain, leucine-rich repeat domain superfamily, F-box-like domain superfamily [Helianthus annuus]|nr:putative F-box domain, leucine-rich repeat domain superfamily, F-box-like domain superfamily [Helianthus annuus]
MGDRKRRNVEGDRLSSLPDDLIHKILSFVSIKQAVETSVLSFRWRFIWTSMPYLSFSSEYFCMLLKFSGFVEHVLLGRNNQTEVFSVELTFRGKITDAFVKKILDYAFSHNVQQLNITCLSAKMIDYTLCRFSSWSLKGFTLTGCTKKLSSITTPPTWELPSLLTLNLHCVTLHDKGADLFSHCANLKNLTLKNCTMIGLDTSNFKICHPGLSSLTFENGYGCGGVNVVTPQLKNLSIKRWQGIHLISAPNLSSLHYIENSCSLKISADFLCLEKVDVCISYVSDKANAHNVVCLLQQLYSVKFLSLNLELIKVYWYWSLFLKRLSSYVELISHQPSPFTDLKSLKIYPTDVPLVVRTQQKLTMSPEVKNYFLGSSPGAIFTMVSREEISAVKNVTLARNLMAELWVLLDKSSMENHLATVPELGEAENHRAQRDTEMKLPFRERMTHIESYWKDRNSQVEKVYNNTCRTISLLRKIEGVLKEVPRSHQAKLQARFSSLCVEAEAIMDDTMDQMKMQFDKKPSKFHKLATATSSQHST